MSSTLSFNISVYCEACYKREWETSPSLMLRISGPFDALGADVGEVGDMYSCPKCKNTVTIITQIDPGEMNYG